jgi:hypothetical protein
MVDLAFSDGNRSKDLYAEKCTHPNLYKGLGECIKLFMVVRYNDSINIRAQ